MVVTLDAEAARASDVVAGTSPLAELMACLHAFAEPEHHPESRAWLAGVREKLPDELIQQLNYHAPLWARYRCRLLYPLRAPLNRELDAELGTLRALDVERFVRCAAIAIRGTPFATEGLGNRERQREFVRECERRSFSRAELARGLVHDPESFRTGLIEVLQRCAETFFAAEWRRLEPHLAEVAARVRDQLRAEPLTTVLASLSPSATAGPGARVSYDKLQSGTARIRQRGCLLVPTLHGWPHLMVKFQEEEMPTVVHFLAGDWTRQPHVSQAMVRDRLAAIAEPARMELCRHLIGEPITTSELAHRTQLSEPQVSRHLRRLREVGLVTSIREGRLVYHRLHAKLLLSLGADVLTTIMR